MKKFIIIFIILYANYAFTLSLPGGIPLPESVNPGRISQDVETKQKNIPKLNKSDIKHIAPKQQSAPKGAEQANFILKKVSIDGATKFKEEDFLDIYKDYIGKEITLDKLYYFRDEVTKKYRNAGYVLSIAIVPPQEIKDGNIKIHVIEGCVNEIFFEGNFAVNNYIKDITNELKSLSPLNMKDLESIILRINQLGGVEANVTVKQSNQSGKVDLLIVMNEKKLSQNIAFDNTSSRYSGPSTLTYAANANNLFVNHSSISFLLNNSTQIDELTYVSLSNNLPINSYGTKLTTGINASKSKPGYTLSSIDIESRSYTLSLGLTHYIPFSRTNYMSISSNIDYKESQTDYLDVLWYRDRICPMTISFSYSDVDSSAAVNSIDLSYAHGLNILDVTETGSVDVSNSQAKSDFNKIYGTLNRVQPIGDNIDMSLTTNWQYSKDILFSSEKFGFGGQYLGKAYDSSELTGEKGIAFGTELRYNKTFTEYSDLTTQFYGFYDVGKVWFNDYETIKQSAASAGGGVRFGYGAGFSGFMNIAVPLTKRLDTPPPGGSLKSTRVFVGMNYSM